MPRIISTCTRQGLPHTGSRSNDHSEAWSRVGEIQTEGRYDFDDVLEQVTVLFYDPGGLDHALPGSSSLPPIQK